MGATPSCRNEVAASITAHPLSLMGVALTL